MVGAVTLEWELNLLGAFAVFLMTSVRLGMVSV
jgi:hypothetical protein